MTHKLHLSLLLLLTCFSAHATIYTATQSGWYNDAGSWGGNRPPSVLQSGDSIIIPQGISIRLDTFVTIDQPNTAFIVDGHVWDTSYSHPMGGWYNPLTIGADAYFGGTGVIDIYNFIGLYGLNASFAGRLAVTKFESRGTTLANANCDVIIRQELYVKDSNFVFHGDSTVLNSGARMVLEGKGEIVFPTSSNILDLSQPHTIQYTLTGTRVPGIELKYGKEQKNISLWYYVDLILQEDLHMYGSLGIWRGNLILNGHDLIFEETGDYTAVSYAVINSKDVAPSNLIIRAKNGLSRPLHFGTYDNAIGNLELDMGAATAVASISSDLTVKDTLLLKRGKLDVNISDLYLNSMDSTTKLPIVVGGSDSSYIITHDSVDANNWVHQGQLKVLMQPSTTFKYPVGSRNRYLPIALINDNHRPYHYGMTAIDPVKQLVDRGYDMSTSQPVVGASWAIHCADMPGEALGLQAQLMWKAGDERNGFDRGKAYISMGATRGIAPWDSAAPTQATMLSNGYYSLTRPMRSIPFSYNIVYMSVFDKQTNVSVAELNKERQTITVYPNPVQNMLHIDHEGRIDIYNMQGQIILSEQLANNTVNVSSLPAGVYMLKAGVATGRFVKE